MRDFFDGNPGLQVLLSATIRNEQTFEAFLNACSGSPFVLLPSQESYSLDTQVGERSLTFVG